MKKLSLFFVVLVLLVFGFNNVFAQGTGANFDPFAEDDSSSDYSPAKIGGDYVDPDSSVDNPTSPDPLSSDDPFSESVVDAGGNLTIKINEDYTKAINLNGGNLIVGQGASVSNVINITNGNVTLLDNSTVKGNINITGGNLTIGSNADIYGNINVSGNLVSKGNLTVKGNISSNTFSAGLNLDISGTVYVGSANGTLSIGDNADVRGTLTSKSGLSIGSNSDVKLFLSGDLIEVDGTMYKLGGKIISRGSNSSVGLPYIPKPKIATSTVNIITAPTQTQTQAVQTTQTVNTVTQNTAAPKVANTVNQNTNTSMGGNDISVRNRETNNNEVTGFDTSASNNPEVVIDRNTVVDKIINDTSYVVTEDDVNTYASEAVQEDSNINNVNLTAEDVSVSYAVPASLFGFIPMSLPANVSVTKDRNVSVKLPWYSFIFSKKANENTIKQNVTEAISDTFNSSNTIYSGGLTTRGRVSISNGVVSAFKGLFGGNDEQDTTTPTTEDVVTEQPIPVEDTTTNQPVKNQPVTPTPTPTQTPAPVKTSSVLKIESSSFANGAKIPTQYTCDGGSEIPSLKFSGVPSTAKSLAVIMDDPDAPGGTYVHWVIWNIKPGTTSIGDGNIPSGAVEGYNTDSSGWYPPCPPSGTHHYNFKLYALDTTLSISDSSSKNGLLNAMNGHILGTATLVGIYGK